MTRQMILAAVCALPLLAVAACDPTEPDFEALGFDIVAEPGQLVLSNEGSAVIRYAVKEKNALMFSSFNLISSVEDWPILDPDSRVVIPNEEIAGYTPEATHASVLWAVGLAYQSTVEIRLR